MDFTYQLGHQTSKLNRPILSKYTVSVKRLTALVERYDCDCKIEFSNPSSMDDEQTLPFPCVPTNAKCYVTFTGKDYKDACADIETLLRTGEHPDEQNAEGVLADKLWTQLDTSSARVLVRELTKKLSSDIVFIIGEHSINSDDRAAMAQLTLPESGAISATCKGPKAESDFSQIEDLFAGTCVTGTVEVTNTYGIHARPAAQIVHLAVYLDSEITIGGMDSESLATSSLDLVMLGACHGAILTVECQGPNALPDFQKMMDLFANGFYEE